MPYFFNITSVQFLVDKEAFFFLEYSGKYRSIFSILLVMESENLFQKRQLIPCKNHRAWSQNKNTNSLSQKATTR